MEPIGFSPSSPVRFWKPILLGGILLGLLAWAASAGYHRYQLYRGQRLIETARRYLNQSDYTSASLSAQQALRFNPENAEAARLMAEIAERSGSRDAIIWRRRVADLEPDSLTNCILWAKTALRFSELASADQALSRIRPAGRDTAIFHQTAAALALQAKELPMAEFHFSAALAKDPANPLNRLNLAIVQLQSGRPATVVAGRAMLESFRADPRYQLAALRALMAKALIDRDQRAARELSEQLKTVSGREARDQLLILEGLFQFKDPQFAAELGRIEQLAAGQAQSIFELLTWLNQHGLARDALTWAESLPSATRQTLPVPLAVADALHQEKKWSQLEAWVGNGSWGAWDFVRFAWLALIDRHEDRMREGRAHWVRAVRLAQADPEMLSLLGHMAAAWQWENEAEELWWMLANGPAGQRPALFTLARLYFQRKDTRKLLQVSERLYAIDPGNPVTRNNLAALSLLLKRNAGMVHQWARENYRAFPSNPAFASTYAYSLCLQGQPAEGLKIMAAFPEADYSSPDMALYYALVLQANGQKEKAAYFLKKAAASTSLLPEEKDLLLEAEEKLRAGAAA